MEEKHHVERILSLASQFNEAVAEAQRADLIIDFTARASGYGSERSADKLEITSIYKSLHTHPRPRAGEDF